MSEGCAAGDSHVGLVDPDRAGRRATRGAAAGAAWIRRLPVYSLRRFAGSLGAPQDFL